jgi:signal transduction histidine kinase
MLAKMSLPVDANEAEFRREPLSDRAVSEFLLRACHDLRAAARAVRTHSELFAREAAGRDAATEQRVGFIVEGAGQIDSLINGIAAYSIALQTDPASFQPVRLDVLVRNVLMKLNREIQECAATVKYADLPEVAGNPDRLMQLFENLLRNAIGHRGQASPEIEIRAQRQGEDWLLVVSDNGPGLEADALDSIFKPFERLAGRKQHGAGLGLAICRAIVERHGGRIWAESRPGEGARFHFTLPA